MSWKEVVPEAEDEELDLLDKMLVWHTLSPPHPLAIQPEQALLHWWLS